MEEISSNRKNIISKISIGTASFGLGYGIKNNSQKTNSEEINKILEEAVESGIEHIDTAFLYGDSERVLGSCGLMSNFKITTKTNKFSNESNIKQYFENDFFKSLENLRVNKVEYLLIHDEKDLLSDNSDLIYNYLIQLKKNGFVKNIGASFYDCEILVRTIDNYEIDAVQASANIFDQRFLNIGILNKLKNRNINLFIRSIYLQGLLLMNNRPEYFSKYSDRFLRLEEYSKNFNLTMQELCLLFIASIDQISGIVIGLNSKKELIQTIDILKNKDLSINFKELLFLATSDVNLINPSLWPKI